MAVGIETVSRAAVAWLRLATALMGLGLGKAAVVRFGNRPNYLDVRRAADQAVRQWEAWE